jgi:hypothetical protein
MSYGREDDYAYVNRKVDRLTDALNAVLSYMGLPLYGVDQGQEPSALVASQRIREMYRATEMLVEAKERECRELRVEAERLRAQIGEATE